MFAFLVSGNNYLPDVYDGGSIHSWGSSFIESIKNVFVEIVVSLKEGINALYTFFTGIDHVIVSIKQLTDHNGISADGNNFVVVDNFIGNIRFACGDLVFTELYILLLIGLGMTLFMVITKLIKAFTYISKSIGGIPFISGIGGNFVSFITKLFQ